MINKKEDERTVSEKMEQFIKDAFKELRQERKTFLEWVNANKNVALKAKNGTTGKAKTYIDWEKYYPQRIKTPSEPYWSEVYLRKNI